MRPIFPVDHFIVGYPKIAALAATDPSFLIYRKFGWLHNRLLLYLQDELVALEYKLNKLDQRTFSHDNEVKLKSRREDFNNPGLRRDTIKQIAEKLKEYGQFVIYLLFIPQLSLSCPSVVPQLSLSCPSVVPQLSLSCPSVVPQLSLSCPLVIP